MAEDNIEFSHSPVMPDECIEGLNIRPGGIIVDGTAGGGGHSFLIAERLTEGELIAIDRDSAAIRAAGKRLEPFADRVRFARNNFTELRRVCNDLGVNRIDGLLLDLGVSSYQLDTPDRGFSYMADAPLDMRMSQDDSLTAYDVVNGYSEGELRRILFEYGEERFAPKIAAAIVRERKKAPIRTTLELVGIIKSAMPASAKVGGHHPAKRSFQAIRIECNRELEVLKNSLDEFIDLLNPGGRLCIITFHSLEDRIVKSAFRKNQNPCTCPPDFPVCVCGQVSKGRVVTRKPILPSEEEILENKRAKSAKLRVFERM